MRGSSACGWSRACARGQTTLDFAIGISVFIAIIVFVFAFVPGILSPFTTAGERHTVQVNRVADSLSQDRLGSSSEPYDLDRETTVDFLGLDDDTLAEDLDLPPGTKINVSILGDPETDTPESEVQQLCWQGGALVEVPCNQRLARGPAPPPENDATISARRVVNLAGEGVILRVVVWR